MIHKTTFQVKVDDDEVHVLLLDSVTVVFMVKHRLCRLISASKWKGIDVATLIEVQENIESCNSEFITLVSRQLYWLFSSFGYSVDLLAKLTATFIKQ